MSAPTFDLSPPVGPVTVPENATAVGAPGLFAATDADSEDEVTYSLSGADASLFNISAGTLMFKEESAPNFEIRNTHEVTVVATGGAGNRALSIMRTITINITDVNEPPAFTSDPAGSASENAVATTFTAAAADPDADDTTAVVTYSIDKTDAATGGADRDLFAIDSSTGALTFSDAPDFEMPRGLPFHAMDNTNDYEVIVTASGGAGDRARQSTQTVTISVTDVNDAPVFTSTPTGSASENAVATTFTAVAADPDADDPAAVVYSIDKTNATTGGADRNRFAIDSATGALTFNTGDAPDFEMPRGLPFNAASNTNDYEVIVTASGGAGERAMQSTQTVTISVTDVNEPPVFTSVAAGSASENAVATTITAAAADPDADDTTVVYSIDTTDATTGGADRDRFAIDSSTGALTFSDAPDFEIPGAVRSMRR